MEEGRKAGTVSPLETSVGRADGAVGFFLGQHLHVEASRNAFRAPPPSPISLCPTAVQGDKGLSESDPLALNSLLWEQRSHLHREPPQDKMKAASSVCLLVGQKAVLDMKVGSTKH